MNHTERTLAKPYTKRHFGWKLAFLQHPMYLLIDEDRGEPTVGERVAPWGASDADEYVERVRRNLDSLERFPDLQLNYEFSAVELKDLCERYPDVYDHMKDLHKRGKLDFVDGTYAQPHLQVFGSETSWRQFEEGMRIYRELFDKDIKVYATQETGLHQQIPQILKQLHFDFLTPPAFPWGMSILSGPYELNGMWNGLQVQKGDDFIMSEALDGSQIPMYNRVQDVCFSDILSGELNKDLYAGPPIFLSTPDLEEVNQPEYEKWSRNFRFCLLHKALQERYSEVGAKGRARVFTSWSYIEGVWAEQLLRENKLSEELLVLGEGIHAMAAAAGLELDDGALDAYWLNLLKYQHHDIYWIEVTDLRQKAIDLYRHDRAALTQSLAELSRKLLPHGDEISCINAIPNARKALAEGQDCAGFQAHKGVSFGIVELPAGGYRSFQPGTPAPSVEKLLPKRIQTEHYQVELSEGGQLNRIYDAFGVALLASGEYMGGEIRGAIDEQNLSNRTADALRFFEGPQAYILERDSHLGHIPIRERYDFLRNMNAIRVTVEFTFNGDQVGSFYLDESKINIYYPSVGGKIEHDIPFGYVEGREEHVLFATNWLKVGGLCYINRGTCKCWVRDGVIANMIGWGGNEFTNRQHINWAENEQYDLKLYGKQSITYYLVPDSKASANETVKAVNDLTAPVFMAHGSGERSLYSLEDDGRVSTAIYANHGKLFARGYQLPSIQGAKLRDFEIFNSAIPG